MRHRSLVVAPLVALAVVLTGTLAGGCANSAANRDKLVESLTLFTDAVRWQQWDTASNYVAHERRKVYLENHDTLSDQIDVTDIEITRRVAGADGRVATVVIALSWLSKSDPVVKKTVLEQRWELLRDSWLITKERRLRGDPLPEPPRRRRPASQPSSQPG